MNTPSDTDTCPSPTQIRVACIEVYQWCIVRWVYIRMKNRVLNRGSQTASLEKNKLDSKTEVKHYAVCIVDLTSALGHVARLLTNGLHAPSGGAPRQKCCWGPQRACTGLQRWPFKNTQFTSLMHSAHCLPFSAKMMHLSTSFYGLKSLYQKKGDIRAQLGSELHAKEATTEYSDSVFQVACSVLHSSSSFAFSVGPIHCQAAHTAGARSGIVVLIHIRLPRSNPSHLTAPTAKCLWTLLVHWPWQINKSRVGLTNLIRGTKKQVESLCRGWVKI